MAEKLGWQTAFREPVPIGRKTIRTLADARAHVLKLPPKERAKPEWQTVARCLMVGAKHSYCEMAEIALRVAINGGNDAQNLSRPNRA